jgi:hypothetical protein
MRTPAPAPSPSAASGTSSRSVRSTNGPSRVRDGGGGGRGGGGGGAGACCAPSSDAIILGDCWRTHHASGGMGGGGEGDGRRRRFGGGGVDVRALFRGTMFGAHESSSRLGMFQGGRAASGDGQLARGHRNGARAEVPCGWRANQGTSLLTAYPRPAHGSRWDGMDARVAPLAFSCLRPDTAITATTTITTGNTPIVGPAHDGLTPSGDDPSPRL